jgi:hypothetical protein
MRDYDAYDPDDERDPEPRHAPREDERMPHYPNPLDAVLRGVRSMSPLMALVRLPADALGLIWALLGSMQLRNALLLLLAVCAAQLCNQGIVLSRGVAAIAEAQRLASASALRAWDEPARASPWPSVPGARAQAAEPPARPGALLGDGGHRAGSAAALPPARSHPGELVPPFP